MSVRTADEVLCDYCEEHLGKVSVETIGGKKLHPDCYDKWRVEAYQETDITSLRFPQSNKRGDA